MSRWVLTPKPDTPLQDSLYYKYPSFNKLQPYENTVNNKRKSRRPFFLLMLSRTPQISSEFRGGGGVNSPYPPSVRHWLLLIAFVFIFKQTMNMETVRFVSIFDKYLTIYGRDQQRRASRSLCEMHISCFQCIIFHDRSVMFEIFYLHACLISITITHSLA